MNQLIIEAFAGPGGWSTGARLAGHTGPMAGIEMDAAACRTAQAAGHQRIRADVATYPLEHLAGKVDGLIQSPPCQAWSTAGDQLGKVDQPLVYERIAAFARGQQPPDREWADDRSKLTAEPMRWAHAIRPRWIALEQVPPVLPLWQYTAEKLREHGYRTWTGILSAEQYGVPQTRRRAILIARRDGLPVGPPAPTHQQYRAGRGAAPADLFGDPLLPPVSMAEALGWEGDVRTGQQSEVRSGVFERYDRSTSAPGPTVTSTTSRWWVMRSNYGTNGVASDRGERSLDQPAPTITSKVGRNKWVQGDEYRHVTVQEAAILQSFPPDYPWQGIKSEQDQQVGDAVPPLLAAAILETLISLAAAEHTA